MPLPNPECKSVLSLDANCRYCILGDGCNMEGISNEACSLAGHWGLGKLIALYDDNKISIDGHTEISFTEDVNARFEALGWHVQHVEDGNTDLNAIRKAIDAAKAVTDKPSMIKVSTLIGYGSPNKADTHGVHGSPLGKHFVQKHFVQIAKVYSVIVVHPAHIENQTFSVMHSDIYPHAIPHLHLLLLSAV